MRVARPLPARSTYFAYIARAVNLDQKCGALSTIHLHRLALPAMLHHGRACPSTSATFKRGMLFVARPRRASANKRRHRHQQHHQAVHARSRLAHRVNEALRIIAPLNVKIASNFINQLSSSRRPAGAGRNAAAIISTSSGRQRVLTALAMRPGAACLSTASYIIGCAGTEEWQHVYARQLEGMKRAIVAPENERGCLCWRRNWLASAGAFSAG